MADLLTFDNLIALVTLTALEIVLGIDNIVFIAILSGKVEPARQKLARQVGLMLAMITRVLLLLAISWMMRLTDPLVTVPVFSHEFSGRDLILFFGGLFLIAKATVEIHDKLEGEEHLHAQKRKSASFASVVLQILILDIIFSLDSVITAVGMVQHIPIMIIAVVVAIIVMLIFSESISGFIHKHPTIKMLALSFLLLIGVMLVAEGFGKHIEKGYIYFAMAFSLLVELLNLRVIKKHMVS